MNNLELYKAISDKVNSERKVLIQKWIEGYREGIVFTLPNKPQSPITNIHKLLSLGIQVIPWNYVWKPSTLLNHTRFILFPSIDQDYVDLITSQQLEAGRLGCELNAMPPKLDTSNNDATVKFVFTFDNITNNDFGSFKEITTTRTFEYPAYQESNKLTDEEVNFILGAIYDVLQEIEY